MRVTRVINRGVEPGPRDLTAELPGRVIVINFFEILDGAMRRMR